MVISLVGPNLFAKHRELRSLVGQAVQQRIYGQDGLAKWYEQLGQSDLFGESPTLIAERIFEDLPKRDQETLAEYLAVQGVADSDQKVIFLVEDEKLLGKSQLGSMLTSQKVLRFPRPTAAKLGMWVQLEADRLKVKIDKQLIPRLVDKLGADQFALQTELERWSLHQPAEITEEVLTRLMPLESEADTFGLTTAWEQKNAATTLDALVALRLQGVAEQMIVGMLGWKVESLLLTAHKRGRVGKWSRGELEAAMSDLYKFDLAVKQGKSDAEVGLELWLVESMGHSGY